MRVSNALVLRVSEASASIIGLSEVIKRVHGAGQSEQRRVSRLLWGCLNQAVRERGVRFLYGHYTWWYSHQTRTEQFPAQFVRLLQESSWLPTSAGELKAPRQMCFDDLPPSFRGSADPLLVELLEFKATEIKQMAERFGVDEDVLSLIREEGLTAEQLRQLLGLPGKSGDADDRSVTGGDGCAEGGFVAADEVSGVSTYMEGATKRVTVNYYERNPEARRECIAYHGCRCVICGIDFGTTYGGIGEGYIHVHHLRDLALLGKEYEVDPIEDLRPVCPNCHAMLHTSRPALAIDTLQEIVYEQRTT